MAQDDPTGARSGKRATINDVARVAEVSKKTVSRVINQSPFVREDTRERVQAAIDTWYRYPSTPEPAPLPAALPFHTLPNLVMTPHMSGWTDGTIRRRQRAMADNVNRLRRGEPLVNRLR